MGCRIPLLLHHIRPPRIGAICKFQAAALFHAAMATNDDNNGKFVASIQWLEKGNGDTFFAFVLPLPSHGGDDLIDFFLFPLFLPTLHRLVCYRMLRITVVRLFLLLSLLCCSCLDERFR